MNKSKKILFLIIFLSLIFSIFISKYNLNNYDLNVSVDGRTYHKMIKTDPYRYLSHGYEIKNQLKKGYNFFQTGRENYTKYLPSRLAALYYYVFDIEFSEEKNEIKDSQNLSVKEGNHYLYLYIQCLIYFSTLVFLTINLSKILNKKILIFIIFFLALEPTIFQYHGTFWSESIFFSLQILIIGIILKKYKRHYDYLMIGFFVGLLSLQKQLAIFYIIPLIIYFYYFEREKFFRSISLILITFFCVQSFLGINNFYRSGKFYIMTADTKVEMHRNMVVKVMSKKLNITTDEFKELEGEIVHEWIKKNDFEINYNTKSLKNGSGFMAFRNSVVNEADRVIVDKFIRKRTLEIIYQNPSDFFKHAFKSAIHVPLLNPFHIYSEHNFVSSEIYYTSQKHDDLILPRIIYSIFIYFFALIGFVMLLKTREYKFNFFLLISFLYFYATIFWHGNTRYYLPCLIYISFFFGVGFHYILSMIIKNYKFDKIFEIKK